MERKRVDIIVPVRDEEENIPLFLQSIKKTQLPESIELGIIFVEDSSRDQTLDLLRKYSREYSNIEYYSLKNPLGQAAAVAFGLKRSEADAMVMMDVDGGHPVEVLPEMLRHYLDGADLVQAVRRKVAQRKTYRRLGALFFNFYLYLVTGFKAGKQNVYFRLVTKRINQRLLQDKRWMHFFRTNFSKKEGIKEKYVYFEALERRVGESKYNLIKLLKAGVMAPLSLITTRRFIFIVSTLGLAVLILFIEKFYYLSSGVFIFASLLVFQFFKMSATDIFNKLEVIEQSKKP